MSRLLRFLALALVLAATAASLPAAADAAQARRTLARQLVDRYFSDLKRHDVADLRAFLSPAFQLQRADGSRATKLRLVALWALLPDTPKRFAVRSYSIRGMRVTGALLPRRDKVLVVTFQMAVDAVIAGKPYRTGYSPRLAAFVNSRTGWHILAMANFNKPR